MATENTNEYTDGIIPMTTGIQVSSAIGLSLLILVGILGNIMTVIAYFADRKHNKIYDFFMFNLAITDLIICCISMPFYAVYTLMEFTWIFGYTFCKVWLVIDYTACTHATLLILILSLDRLLLITLGTSYVMKVTWKKSKTLVVISWIIAFMCYGPAIIGWNHWVGYSTVESWDCDVEFAYHNIFVNVMSVFDLVLPALCLIILNGLIFWKLRTWSSARQKKFTCGPISDKIVSLSAKDQSGFTDLKTLQDYKGDGKRDKILLRENIKTCHMTETSKCIQQTKIETNNEININEISPKNSKINFRPVRLLVALVFSFLLFWTPFTVATMVIASCDNKCINLSLFEFFNWFLWIKSAVNPLLYAFNSPRYRKCFLRYITLNGRLVCRYRR